MTTYTAPNGTTFSYGDSNVVTMCREAYGQTLRVTVEQSDLISFLLSLPLTTVLPTPNAPATATVRDALEALGKLAKWDVGKTSGENAKRMEEQPDGFAIRNPLAKGAEERKP